MCMQKIWNVLQLKHYWNTTDKFSNGHWNEYTRSPVLHEQLEKYQQGEGEGWWTFLLVFGTNTNIVKAPGLLFHSFNHFYCLLQIVQIILEMSLTAYSCSWGHSRANGACIYKWHSCTALLIHYQLVTCRKWFEDTGIGKIRCELATGAHSSESQS